MLARNTIHAALVTTLDAVSGLTASPVGFDAVNIPAHGASGWFILRPEGEIYLGGGPDGTGSGMLTLQFTVALLWSVATQPNTAIQSAMAMVGTIVAALNNEVTSATDARINVGEPSITYPSAQFAVIEIPLSATGLMSGL